jgi:hypothetical protein
VYFVDGKYEFCLDNWEKAVRLNSDAEGLALVKAVRQEYSKSRYRGAVRAVRRYAELQEEQSKRIYSDPAVPSTMPRSERRTRRLPVWSRREHDIIAG